MRLLVRVIMAVSLIVADAAQAASLSVSRGSTAAEDDASHYGARLQRILDRDEKNWRRLSASICTGCGSPGPASDIASATPLYIQARREAAAAIADPTVGKPKADARPVAMRSAEGVKDEDRGQAVRSKPRAVRTAKARRHVRYARLRLIRHQRRVALLRAQRKKQAVAVLKHRPTPHRVRVADLGVGALENGRLHRGDERRPVPFPPPRPDTLCADDRVLRASKASASTACVDTP